jgi:tRNA A37 N6-isopentenylltransferase MiaA
MRKHIIIIYGPTGVGKSDYAVALANDFPMEIVNCDVGQLYTAFSIGTAKPDWKQEKHRIIYLISLVTLKILLLKNTGKWFLKYAKKSGQKAQRRCL